jgi:hypothetical protein
MSRHPSKFIILNEITYKISNEYIDMTVNIPLA